MPSNTRERLIDAASHRFYRDGFRNVGIDQILDDVGITKTSFYKHFESKDDLMLAVLDRYDRELRERFRGMIRKAGGRAAGDQLYALLDVVKDLIEGDDFHGCIFVNAAMEFPLAHEPAHQSAKRNKQAIGEIVFEVAERAGAADPGELAQELCLTIEGAYVTRQVTGKPDTIAIARRVADRIIRDHMNRAD